MISKLKWLVAPLVVAALVGCGPVEDEVDPEPLTEEEAAEQELAEEVAEDDADGSTVTGSPADADSFSLAIDDAVVSGAMNTDGLEAQMTIRVSDRFNKAVDDGTIVYLWAEHGFFKKNFCLTDAGACSASWVSSGLRPVDGLVTILTYAVGEDSYVESGVANGIYNVAADTVGFDNTALSGDEALLMSSEAFKDYDFDGVYDEAPQTVQVYFDVNFDGVIDVNDTVTYPEDAFLDYNGNGVFDETSTKFRGTDCSAAAVAAGHCAESSIYVWDNAQLVLGFSNDAPNIAVSTATATKGVPFTVTVSDSLFNRPATGTSIKIEGPASDTTFEANILGGSTVGAAGSAGNQNYPFSINIVAGNTGTATITVTYLGNDYKKYVDY